MNLDDHRIKPRSPGCTECRGLYHHLADCPRTMERAGDCASCPQLVNARRLLERCEALISPQYAALIDDLRSFLGINARGERTTPIR